MKVIKFTKTRLYNLTNIEVLSLANKTIQLVENSSYSELPAGAFLKKNANALKMALNDSMKKKSLSLEAEDGNVDGAYAAMNGICEYNAKAAEPAISGAANTILEVLHRFPNPVRMSYDEEYALLALILEQLKALDARVFEAAGVSHWYAALVQHDATFRKRWTEVNAERNQREVGTVRNARRAFGEAFLAFIDFVSSKLVFDATPELEEFAGKLNEMTQEFTMRAKAGATRKANGGTMDEPSDVDAPAPLTTADVDDEDDEGSR